METKSCSKVAQKYYCKTCDYTTCKTSSYTKHCLSAKHNLETLGNQKLPKSCSKFCCDKCSKIYESRAGLWKHSKKCSPTPILENKMIVTTDNIPDYIKELKDIIIEQNKTIVDLATKTGNNNNNTQFNLQFFLNETCKDAINVGQFIENLKISFADLENIGNKGYVDGITNIIVNELKTMDITKRPFHCTDMKRETMYIKEKDEWNKDNEDKSKLICVINNVLNKNKVIANEWYKTHPEINVLDSPDYIMHMKLFEQLLAQENENKLKEKIVKNIAKETGNIR